MVPVVGTEEMVHTLVLHMILNFLMRMQNADCQALYVTRICLQLDKSLSMVLKLHSHDLWIMLLNVY